MKMLDFFTFIGIAVTVYFAVFKGEIKTTTVGMLIIVGSLILIVARKNWIVRIIGLAIPVFLFIRAYGVNTDLGPLLAIIITAFGCFIIFRSIFHKKKRDDD